MNQRFVSVLIFAFLVAAGASLLLYRLTASRLQSTPSAPTVPVIVAARNLEAGTLIRPADLRVGAWVGALPAGALVKKEGATDRGVLALIFENEPVLESRLAPRGAGAGLAAMIPAGMRAVAVRVNEVVGVAGFVVPGMRVDVLVSGTPPGSSALGSVTQTLLQNIQVLSAGQDFKKDAEGKPVQVQVVNLLVTPQQAEKLSLASFQTTIQLVLRNPLDTQVAATSGAALAHLFTPGARPAEPRAPAAATRTLPRPQPPPPVAPRVQAVKPPESLVIETIHGSKRVETKFADQAGVRQ